MWLWPPFFGAGIRVKSWNDALTRIEVELVMRPWNRNYVGTHFGGSLYAMADPFFMLILMHHLGRDFIVWDKASSIHFLKPGRGRVTAIFEIEPETIQNLRDSALSQYKVEPTFKAQVVSASGEVVAEISKLLYIRKKQQKSAAAA